MTLNSDTDKRVLIPVEWKSGKWQPLDGSEMPVLAEGTLADLTVPHHAFIQPRDISRFSTETVVEILPAGSYLWALISTNHGVSGLGDPLLKGLPARHAAENSSFLVRFSIKEPLNLRLRGTKPAQLEPCPCQLPGFPEDLDVGSINQAYTRLSERYEPRRKSHAGNVFQQVLFETTPGGPVRPLDDLRLKAVIESEKKLQEIDESRRS